MKNEIAYYAQKIEFFQRKKTLLLKKSFIIKE